MMRPAFPAVWLSARGVKAMHALALGLALASVLPVLLPLFFAALLVLVALVAVDAALGPSRSALRIARGALPPLALRRPARLTYVLENRAPLAVRVGLIEAPLSKLAFGATQTLARVAPGARFTATLAIEPRERGAVTLGPFYVWTENRIGFLRRRFRVDAHEEARIFPDLSAVEGRGKLAERRTLLEAGLRRLRRRGAGTEFESLREYGAGDAFREIDWKATAHRGRTMVAQYEVERSQNVIVALDCGRMMSARLGAQRKLDYAVTAALSLARIAQRADDNVGLAAFAAHPILDIAPRRGAAHYRALTQTLYDVQPRLEEADYETTFTALRRRYAKRSLIVLFSDILDPATSSAVLTGLSLLVPRHLVLCVLMNDATIAAALDHPPQTARDAFRTVVAMRLADERAKALAALRSRGIRAIDVPAAHLSVAAIDAYLDIKARGRL